MEIGNYTLSILVSLVIGLMGFINLKHCGIIADRKSFYHAQTSIRTNLSRFTPFWVSKIVGFRRIPQSEAR